MSRIAQPPRMSNTGDGNPRSSRISQSGISQSGIRQPSQTKTPGDANKTAADPNKTKKQEKKAIEFQLPPLSIVGKKKEIDFEAIRKKVTRRSNPEGEDKKELASILKHLRESKAKIKVHEFVSLVAKFTVDNGEIMRKVLEDDLAVFRKTVTKVYENMTQDVSDVLVNEQIQTSNYYQEKYDMFHEKLLLMIGEIFQMIPEFDFEQYAKDREDYLNLVDPLPSLIVREAGAVDIQKRQEAFHRLQWLKIEGGRLAEENKRLEEKLNNLAVEHEKNQAVASLKAKIMKERKQNLEQEEHAKQEHLHELEGLLGKSAVRAEAYVRLEEDERVRMAKPAVAKEPIKKTAKRKKLKRPEWSSVTAADMEAAAAKDLVESENAAMDEKKRQKRKEKELTYGPDTTMVSRQMSQSQYAPEEMVYPGLPSAARMKERNIQQTTTTIQERRQPPRGGRYQAPRDSWGGFN